MDKNSNPTQHRLWSVEDVAAYLDVPKSKIYSLTRQKGPDSIPRYKIDRYLRFVQEEIDMWLESKRLGFRS